jgi:hypothetical protein
MTGPGHTDESAFRTPYARGGVGGVHVQEGHRGGHKRPLHMCLLLLHLLCGVCEHMAKQGRCTVLLCFERSTEATVLAEALGHTGLILPCPSMCVCVYLHASATDVAAE